MKNTLLGATAVIALTAGAATGATLRSIIEVHGAAAAAHPRKPPAALLYNQNSSGYGAAFDSQNFTSGSFTSPYFTAGADDFVLASPATMTGVDATGIFFNGPGPANGAWATLYTGNRTPVTTIAKGESTGRGPNFSIRLGKKLKPGTHYWISVVANCSFTGGCGEWGWEVRPRNHKPAVWEYPFGGPPCTTWQPLGDCTDLATFQNADFMFDIRGQQQH